MQVKEMQEIDTPAMNEDYLDIQRDGVKDYISHESLETIKKNESKASGNENEADEKMVT